FPTHDVGPTLREQFSVLHEQHYGYRSEGETIETMNVRVIARGSSGKSQIPESLAFGDDSPSAGGARSVYFGPAFGALNAPICARGGLGPHWRAGPLLVEEFDSTTVVPPDGRARCVAWDTIEIELE
ncbi:MAG: hypothetical protein ACKVQT_37865, partial [Burkholderiales bacterium]